MLIRKIWTTLVVWVFVISGYIHAQSVVLETTTTLADINTPLWATVTIDGLQGGDVHIAGLDNFDVVSQSRSQSIQIINGRQAAQVQLQLRLQPQEVGTFTLWPAIVQSGNEEYTSQSILIEVQGESLFGNSAAVLSDPTWTQSSWSLFDMRSLWNWIGIIFWLIIVVLIIHVIRVARRKTILPSRSVWSQKIMDQSYVSSWMGYEWSIQAVIEHARSQTDTHTHLSLSELNNHTHDGALKWLLARIEQVTYANAQDSLLEDDCKDYLNNR